MALIDCPECRHRISDQAPACPQCGHPLQAESAPVVRTRAQSGPAKLAGFALIVAGVLLGIAGGHAGVSVFLVVAGFIAFIAGRLGDS